MPGRDRLPAQHRDGEHPAGGRPGVERARGPRPTACVRHCEVGAGDHPSDGEVATCDGEFDDPSVTGVLAPERRKRAAHPHRGDDGNDERGTPEQGGAG
jgi:hypothetical protein